MKVSRFFCWCSTLYCRCRWYEVKVTCRWENGTRAGQPSRVVQYGCMSAPQYNYSCPVNALDSNVSAIGVELTSMKFRPFSLPTQLLQSQIAEVWLIWSLSEATATTNFGELILFGNWYAGPDVKRGEADTVWRIDDSESSFHTRPFKIRYSRQDVLLQEMVSFHLKVGKQVRTVLTISGQYC